MSLPQQTISKAEQEELDCIYREGGLRRIASPQVHYEDESCPHAGCGRQMERIDFRLQLQGANLLQHNRNVRSEP